MGGSKRDTMITQSTTHDLTAQKNFHYIGGLPLLGNLLDFTRDRLGLFRRMARTGDVCGIHFGPFPGILFNKPEHFQSILVKHAYTFDKGEALHRTLRPVIGDGIISSEGDFHRQQRKLLAPPFQPRHIASYAETMGQYGEQIQQTWSDGSVIGLNQQMSNLTLSIIGKTLFDADVFTETDELGAAMVTTFAYVSHALAMPFLPPYSWPLPGNRRMHKAEAILRQRIQRFIDERRNHPIERNDFLSMLLQARDEDGQPMSDQQVMAECITLFGAGYETTAAALSWTWYLLCQHQEIYQRVQQEVDTVLQGRTPTYADLPQLPYCLQVFKESLRIYPPAYATCRRTLTEVKIDGYLVPKGWTVLLVPYTLHRREEYFPEPEKFDPERFALEREKQLPRYAYMPFGAGPRICIGVHFAMMEGQLLLATLAQRVRFSLIPGQSIQPDPTQRLVLRPSGAVKVRVSRR
jgi:cytochrome P450